MMTILLSCLLLFTPLHVVQLQEQYEDSELDGSESRKRKRAESIKFELSVLINETRSAISQLGQILKEMCELNEEVIAELKFDVSRLDGMPLFLLLQRNLNQGW